MVDNISYFENTPSYFEMQTLTPCDILVMDGIAFLKLIKTNNEIHRLTLKAINDYMKVNQKKQSLFQLQSAQERYLEFCESKREILKSVKLADLASYLGITQQSLSRIRKSAFKSI